MYNAYILDQIRCTSQPKARAMEATVAERGQITLPKAVRDALGLVKGTQLKVELDGSRIILRKNVDDAVSRLRGRFKLPPGVSTDDVMRELRGRAPGDPVDF
jgi:antitoxin PrlF